MHLNRIWFFFSHFYGFLVPGAGGDNTSVEQLAWSGLEADNPLLLVAAKASTLLERYLSQYRLYLKLIQQGEAGTQVLPLQQTSFALISNRNTLYFINNVSLASFPCPTSAMSVTECIITAVKKTVITFFFQRIQGTSGYSGSLSVQT